MSIEVKEFETTVTEVIQRSHDVKSFRFKAPDDIEFRPGQFFFITIKINDEESTKHFSFSNSPTEKGYIEFTKRLTDSEFSQALDRLKAGDWARIKMPYGLFTFEGEYDRIAFLAGGIGITPIRSICKYACNEQLSADIILIYGNKTERDIVFYDDFLAMDAKNERLKIVYTVDNPINKDAWKGQVGFITAEMIREEIPDYNERMFYICGPPRMVDYLMAMLSDELKIDKNKIKFERFTGYS